METNNATNSATLAHALAREIVDAFRVVDHAARVERSPRTAQKLEIACTRCAAIDRRIDANIREGMGERNFDLAAMRHECERSHA